MGLSPTAISPAHRRLLKRSLRIGLAAALATFCSQLLHLPNPWFATVAAIVAMQSTLQATLRSGRNSILGAFIGAVSGLAVASVARDQAWAVGVVVMAPLVIFGWFKLRSIGQQAALVASVVVLVPSRPEFTTFDFAVIRFGQAAIGIIVAMVVQALVFPPRAHRKVRRELAGVYHDMATMIGHVTEAFEPTPFDHAAVRHARVDGRERLAQVDEFWDDAMAEHPSHSVLSSHWRVTSRRVWEQCVVLATEVSDERSLPLLQACAGELVALTSLIERSLRDISRWFRHSAPDSALDLVDLEPARRAALDAVRDAEEHDASQSFARTLKSLAVANACNVIAERLTDLATEHRDAVRIHGPLD